MSAAVMADLQFVHGVCTVFRTLGKWRCFSAVLELLGKVTFFVLGLEKFGNLFDNGHMGNLKRREKKGGD